MIEVLDLKFEEYINETKIQERVKAIAAELNLKYAGKDPLFLGILSCSFVFISDICNRESCSIWRSRCRMAVISMYYQFFKWYSIVRNGSCWYVSV